MKNRHYRVTYEIWEQSSHYPHTRRVAEGSVDVEAHDLAGALRHATQRVKSQAMETVLFLEAYVIKVLS